MTDGTARAAATMPLTMLLRAFRNVMILLAVSSTTLATDPRPEPERQPFAW
ncbi:hypothetical protein T261_0358 [Streptomyces lydicus]|nr:hypothetical protein T261_0358 [Streptomyces lydicus]